MTEKDLLVAPFYFLLLLAIAINQRNKLYDKGHPLRKYFLPALLAKFIGAISAGLVYYFYYTDGDTRGYFSRGTMIYEILLEDISKGLALLFPSKTMTDEEIYRKLIFLRAWHDPSSYMVFRIVALVNLLALNTYSSVALLFAYVSFRSSWRVFEIFSTETPALTKKFAFAILFIPSVVFWGSGIFKDTVCFICVMTLVYCIYKIFLEKKLSPRLWLELILAIYLLLVIKTYIILSFLPALGIWIFLTYQKKIKNTFTRIVSTPLFISMAIGFGMYSIQKIGEYNPEFAMENIRQRAYDMQEWHTIVAKYHPEGDEGGHSYYSLGEVGDFSTIGMLKKFPLAVNVTLFRPYLWEARTPFILLSALESLFFFYVTLQTLTRVGLSNSLKIILANPIVLFSMLFAIFFAFGVGYTSYNFGALVRYKIPCMPFYLLGLYFIQYFHQLSKQPAPKPTTDWDEAIGYRPAA